ncbi:MAG: hypothetical protein OJF59_002312 [Cytophagales bacterium]|nr:MAG: hypothetical protein OJF59_002312 [Cytophagales bacterium]
MNEPINAMMGIITPNTSGSIILIFIFCSMTQPGHERLQVF